MKIYKARSCYRPPGAPDVPHVVIEGVDPGGLGILLIRGFGHTADHECREELNKILGENKFLFGTSRVPSEEERVVSRNWVGCWFVSRENLFDSRELKPVFSSPDDGEWE